MRSQFRHAFGMWSLIEQLNSETLRVSFWPWVRCWSICQCYRCKCTCGASVDSLLLTRMHSLADAIRVYLSAIASWKIWSGVHYRKLDSLPSKSYKASSERIGIGKSPDGLTLIRWRDRRCVTWDVSLSHSDLFWHGRTVAADRPTNWQRCCWWFSGKTRLAVRSHGLRSTVSVDLHRRLSGRHIRHYHTGAYFVRQSRSDWSHSSVTITITITNYRH